MQEPTQGRGVMAERRVFDIGAVQVDHGIVGRVAELEAIRACLAAGRHVLLEGPAGVGKTVLALAVARALGRPVFRVDGDGRFTEQKLVGHFDPPGVLRDGYRRGVFLKGPLVEAMERGGVLFINELNRMPEGVQNVLLPVLDEGRLVVPLLDSVVARPGFAVIATMNPREFVATGHLSEAMLDRFELVVLDYQSEEEEREIVRRRTRGSVPEDLVVEAVRMVRATREHPSVLRGASVRAAIAMVEIARQLDRDDALTRAAAIALPTRIELEDTEATGSEDLVRELAAGKKNR